MKWACCLCEPTKSLTLGQALYVTTCPRVSWFLAVFENGSGLLISGPQLLHRFEQDPNHRAVMKRRRSSNSSGTTSSAEDGETSPRKCAYKRMWMSGDESVEVIQMDTSRSRTRLGLAELVPRWPNAHKGPSVAPQIHATPGRALLANRREVLKQEFPGSAGSQQCLCGRYALAIREWWC